MQATSDRSREWLARGDPELRPIHKISLLESIIDKIADLVRDGKLEMGSKLPSENTLAGQLGISRASLREALKALNLLGLIRARAGRGTYIADSFHSSLRLPLRFVMLLEPIGQHQLVDLLGIVEPRLAELAAERAETSDLKAMGDFIEAMQVSRGNLERYIRYEVGFHQALASAAGNKIISILVRSLENSLRDTKTRVALLGLDIEEDIARHRRIHQAIKGKDAKRAGKLIAEEIAGACVILFKNGGVAGSGSAGFTRQP